MIFFDQLCILTNWERHTLKNKKLDLPESFFAKERCRYIEGFLKGFKCCHRKQKIILKYKFYSENFGNVACFTVRRKILKALAYSMMKLSVLKTYRFIFL